MAKFRATLVGLGAEGPDAVCRTGSFGADVVVRHIIGLDPSRRGDVVITEPLDTKAYPNLEPKSLHVTFRDGRVVDIKRVADM